MSNSPTELMHRLEKLAYKKTKPFCYHCYEVAPSGRCDLCGSDDLMRLRAGEGIEYGVDWVIQSLIRENLTPINEEEAFEETIRECYPETTRVAWIEVDTVICLKECDKVSWDLAQSEWIDNEVSDENMMTFDNGATQFWTRDIEQYVEEEETALEAAG